MFIVLLNIIACYIKDLLFYIFQSRQELTSPEPDSSTLAPNRTKIFHARSQSGGLADITVHSCATPPQHRRRLFNPKSLRSPFGQRRPVNKANFTENSSTLSGKQNSHIYLFLSIYTRNKEARRLYIHKIISNQQGITSLETSTHSDSIVTRRIRSKCSSTDNKSQHRLSLGSTSAYAGHLSSLVFGKIKSLWTAQSSTANSGLNQLAGTNFY